MTYFQEIQNRTSLNNLVSYLMTGTDTDEEMTGSRDELLDNAYDRLFSQLEHMYAGANRDDSKLFDAVIDFAIVHQDVYFEAGILAGFQLYKQLNSGYTAP